MLSNGQKAPAVVFRKPGGKSVSLAEITSGGAVLLAFYKASCPTCQFTLPFLDRLHSENARALQVFAVSQDRADEADEFRRQFHLRLPFLVDDDTTGYAASNAFGIQYVPSVFLVEADGSISWTMEGFSRMDMEALGRRAGASLFQPGENVPPWRAG